MSSWRSSESPCDGKHTEDRFFPDSTIPQLWTVLSDESGSVQIEHPAICLCREVVGHSSESRCLQFSRRNRRIFSFLPLRMPLILSSVLRKYGQNAFSGIVIPHQGTHTHARIHGSGESAATTLCSALGHQIHIPAPGNSPGFEYYE